MNTKQHNKLAMYLAVQTVLDTNNAVWQSMQPFADGYAEFTSHIGNIKTLAQGQVLGTKGIAQDKKQSRIAMGTLALEIASALRAYAVKSKNNTLAEKVNFSLSNLTQGRDADVLEKCQNILANANVATGGIEVVPKAKTKARAIITPPGGLPAYGITPDKLQALQAAINTFSDAMGKPRNNIVANKTVTEQLNNEFDGADVVLKEVLDNLVGQFRSGNAKFVADYKNARTIVDIAASHTVVTPGPQPAPTPAPQPVA